MKTFTFAAKVHAVGTIKAQANTREEAIEKAKDLDGMGVDIEDMYCSEFESSVDYSSPEEV